MASSTDRGDSLPLGPLMKTLRSAVNTFQGRFFQGKCDTLRNCLRQLQLPHSGKGLQKLQPLGALHVTGSVYGGQSFFSRTLRRSQGVDGPQICARDDVCQSGSPLEISNARLVCSPVHADSEMGSVTRTGSPKRTISAFSGHLELP